MTVRESALLERKSLIADTVRELPCLHEERELIEARSGLTVCFIIWLRFNMWASLNPLLDVVTLDCLGLVA